MQGLVCRPASSAVNSCVGTQPTTTGNSSSWDKTIGLKKLMIMPTQPFVEKGCHLQPLSASPGENEGLGAPWLQRLIVGDNGEQMPGGWGLVRWASGLGRGSGRGGSIDKEGREQVRPSGAQCLPVGQVSAVKVPVSSPFMKWSWEVFVPHAHTKK